MNRFDFWEYFKQDKNGILIVGKYKVLPINYEANLKYPKVSEVLVNIRNRCANDVERFMNGNFSVFAEFDKNRNIYCRKGNATVFVRFVKIKRDNYLRVYYSPYLEFVSKLRVVDSEDKKLIEIVKNFKSDIYYLHKNIPNQLTVEVI